MKKIATSLNAYSLRMMLLIVMIGFTSGIAFGQPAEKAKLQGQLLANALVRKDYTTFLKYSHPLVISKAGGSTKMIEVIKKGNEKLKENNIVLTSITVGAPSTIITAGNELQCTLPLTTEMKLQFGRMMVSSTLIGISTDKGKNWLFTDAGGKDLATIKTVLPSLSKDLKIPKMQQPKFLPE